MKQPDLSIGYLEIINPTLERGRIRCALFDFDGTISVIRQGWQDLMAALMVDYLRETPHAEAEAALFQLAHELIARTTGQATVKQMAALAEAVQERGGQPEPAEHYKAAYLERLAGCINERLDRLKAGQVLPQTLMIAGVDRVLDAFQRWQITCYLASGTDHEAVVNETGLLDLAVYFDERIYGARRDEHQLNKTQVIDLIKERHQVSGPELVVLGDGVVEIEAAKAAGAIAVGVASDEAARRGLDPAKQVRLIAAGADLIIPDFSRADLLLAYLFPERPSRPFSDV